MMEKQGNGAVLKGEGPIFFQKLFWSKKVRVKENPFLFLYFQFVEFNSFLVALIIAMAGDEGPSPTTFFFQTNHGHHCLSAT